MRAIGVGRGGEIESERQGQGKWEGRAGDLSLGESKGGQVEVKDICQIWQVGENADMAGG